MSYPSPLCFRARPRALQDKPIRCGRNVYLARSTVSSARVATNAGNSTMLKNASPCKIPTTIAIIRLPACSFACALS